MAVEDLWGIVRGSRVTPNKISRGQITIHTVGAANSTDSLIHSCLLMPYRCRKRVRGRTFWTIVLIFLLAIALGILISFVVNSVAGFP